LEEIDLVVQSIPGMRRAVTVISTGKDEGELSVAFVADRVVGIDEVQKLCKGKLPFYMRPAHVVQLDELPCNANGKVDRRGTRALLEQKNSR
jgi:acyl-CoA synthetase (AMP-forming)/AMP-acid ligase II